VHAVTTHRKDRVLVPILINGRRVVLLADTGAATFLGSEALCKELGLYIDKRSPDNKIGVGGTSQMVGYTRFTIRIGKHKCVATSIVSAHELSPDFWGLLGFDVMPSLGITLTGVPATFSDSDLTEDQDEWVYTRPNPIETPPSPSDAASIARSLEKHLKANAASDSFCSHPDSVVHLDTGTSKPSFVK
jgi:hypothetical protein